MRKSLSSETLVYPRIRTEDWIKYRSGHICLGRSGPGALAARIGMVSIGEDSQGRM